MTAFALPHEDLAGHKTVSNGFSKGTDKGNSNAPGLGSLKGLPSSHVV